MANRILVLVELRDGKPLPAVLELISAARSFAPVVEGLSYAEGGATCAALLGAYGMGRLVDLGGLRDSLPGPRVAAAIVQELAACPVKPDALFFPMTYDGRDIAARVSARLDLPVITNVVGLSEDESGFVSEHAIFGGTAIARARFTGCGPAIFIISPKSFPALERGDASAEVESVLAVEQSATDGAKIIARHASELSGPTLDDATVVVAGGRGLADKVNFQLVEQLAKALKGAPGATRALVDAGWVPFAYQIGQTGKTVTPEVYIACAISGATQHLVGINGSKHIIAINKDPSAPIFTQADLGIVGDVNEILPRLIRALDART